MQAERGGFAGIGHDLRTTDVHPPLYFWAVSLWRQIFGSGLIAARVLSVLCGLISLSLVGVIARRCAIQPALAMLLTLGCYGFGYTNAIARGFAPAQALILGGIALLLHRRTRLAGACLGAACCCNYLAVFVAAACIVAAGGWMACLAALPFLGLDAWFFLAQHASRPDQFAPFALWPSLVRLAEYQTAAVFGGLPLYVDGLSRMAVTAIIGLAAVAVAGRVARLRPLVAAVTMRVLLAGALAPAAGLLILGVVFDNTPIELRYLSFGLPFVAMLIAATRARRLIAGILVIQFAAITGLLLAPATMQPARTAALEAAASVGDGVVLLPRGNDGVGIVGAFGIEAAPAMPILLVGPDETIAERLGGRRRVVLVLMRQDRDSIAAIDRLHGVLTLPNWRRVAIGSSIEVYERSGKAD